MMTIKMKAPGPVMVTGEIRPLGKGLFEVPELDAPGLRAVGWVNAEEAQQSAAEPEPSADLEQAGLPSEE